MYMCVHVEWQTWVYFGSGWFSSVKLSGDGGDTYNTNNNDGSSDSQKTLPDTQPVDSDDTVTSSLDNQVCKT